MIDYISFSTYNLIIYKKISTSNKYYKYFVTYRFIGGYNMDFSKLSQNVQKGNARMTNKLVQEPSGNGTGSARSGLRGAQAGFLSGRHPA